jgi:hypothetical protein
MKNKIMFVSILFTRPCNMFIIIKHFEVQKAHNNGLEEYAKSDYYQTEELNIGWCY